MWGILSPLFGTAPAQPAAAQEPPSAGIRFADIAAPASVAAFAKFEITFQVKGASATNFQFPFDPNPPSGVNVAGGNFKGISVDAAFTPDDWRTVFRQPAFYSLEFEDGGPRTGLDGSQRIWRYPTGTGVWKVRFTPHRAGVWQYMLFAVDASGSVASPAGTFSVGPSAGRGFIRVSKRDPRYFEFDDGTVFLTPGVQATVRPEDPPARIEDEFRAFDRNDLRLLRVWISDFYGTAWLRWRGARNIHDGYVPRAGILPFHDAGQSQDLLTLALQYPEDWFDSCYVYSTAGDDAIKPNTTYLLSVDYRAEGIAGPRLNNLSRFGLVGRVSATAGAGCSEPEAGSVVTSYGGNSADWQTVKGLWTSGEHAFLPRLSVGLENVTAGWAQVKSISLKEVLPDGRLGPEVLDEPSMQYDAYFRERSLLAMDRYLELAERYGLFLKVVLMEKNDHLYRKLDDDGSYVLNGEADNIDGFYGLGRAVNKTRWLQRAWWRYVAARWGYSTSIHSWELTNEGDPFAQRHWEAADELGKFMHCEVFGAPVSRSNGAACALEHPNRHLVTTSFWHSFPGYSAGSDEGFWGSPKYPNIDYADVHAYIATSPASDEEKSLMEADAAYYHLWHSREYGAWRLPMPLVRGEAGMVPKAGSTDDYEGLGLANDEQGLWYHNFVWSSLDDGALYEIYWYSIPHIYNPGKYDHRPVAAAFARFVADIPVSNGHYHPVSAEGSSSALRVIGQVDLVNGRAHLWVQNRAHTWRSVVGGAEPPGVSGAVRIAGLRPNRFYQVQWWDTRSTDGQALMERALRTSDDGVLIAPVENLKSDVALKISELGRPQSLLALPGVLR